MILPRHLGDVFISLLVKCVPTLAFLLSIGVTQDTISVGPTRGPDPVFRDI